MQHPNIVPVHAAGTSAGLPYFIMPYVAGASLRARMHASPISIADAAYILRDIAKALAFAHKHGVVHRDIKPENVLIADNIAIVTDFGVAKAISDASKQPRDGTLTHAGSALGTPAYMSPEQAAGDPAVDHRADLYAWGMLAYELLAGMHPFADKRTAHELISAQLVETPPPVETRASGVPPSLSDVVRRCLAKTLPSGPQAPRSWSLRSEAMHIGAQQAPNAESRASIAVLPFSNLSADPADEYFSDGMTEELIYVLTRLKALRVTARTSSFAFKGQGLDARTIAQRLGVSAVLEGSVRRAGNRLRIAARLVDAKDGYERWSERFDRDLGDVFELQDEIARAIAAALEVQLVSADVTTKAVQTQDLRALELYLKGRFAWNQRTETTIAEAVRYFKEAVTRDPTFARAHAGLADASLALPMYTGVSPSEAWPNAREAALRALALDPTLAEAHTSLAYGTMLYEWDWPRAEANFHKAIACDATYSTAHHWYADFLVGRGRLEEGLREMQRARELDPVSRITGAELAWMLHLVRRTGDAMAQIDQVLQLDPNYAHAHFIRGLIRITAGQYGDASRALRQSLDLGGFYAFTHAALIYALARAGDPTAAHALLAELQTRARVDRVPPFAFAVAFTGLGQLHDALAWIRRGIDERDELLAENFFDPLFDPLRSDPQYLEVLQQLGAVRAT
ncbi:MAG: protein kinase domain-containing protein [Gemmatimonadaceae bacterium]